MCSQQHDWNGITCIALVDFTLLLSSIGLIAYDQYMDNHSLYHKYICGWLLVQSKFHALLIKILEYVGMNGTLMIKSSLDETYIWYLRIYVSYIHHNYISSAIIYILQLIIDAIYFLYTLYGVIFLIF